jgi:hypothetical protein
MTGNQPSSPDEENPIFTEIQPDQTIDVHFSYTTSKRRKDVQDKQDKEKDKEQGKDGSKEHAVEQTVNDRIFIERIANVEKILVRWAKPFVPEATPQLEGEELNYPPEVLMQYLTGLSQELEQKVESARQAQLDRLERLSQTQQEFVRLAQHFINPEFRPDLGESALSNEPDQLGGDKSAKPQ